MDTQDQRTLKGDATRARMLAEAMRLFAERGYEGVSTRALATAAESNVALITFHFGSKRGLYEAALAAVRDRLADVLMSPVERLRQTLAEYQRSPAANPDTLLHAMRNIIQHMLIQLLPATPTPGFFQLLSREMQEQGEHSEKIWQVLLPIRSGLEDVLHAAATPEQRGSHEFQARSRLAAFLLINSMLAIVRDYAVFRPHFVKDGHRAESQQHDANSTDTRGPESRGPESYQHHDASTLADLLCAGLAAALERRMPCRHE